MAVCVSAISPVVLPAALKRTNESVRRETDWPSKLTSQLPSFDRPVGWHKGECLAVSALSVRRQANGVAALMSTWQRHRNVSLRAALLSARCATTEDVEAEKEHIEVALPPLQQLTPGEPAAVRQRVKAFAPATVANLGPGFDFLGCAVQGLGDHVIAELSPDVPGGQVAIKEITGDGGKLSLAAGDNCVGIAAQATLQLLGVRSHGVALTLHKGLPLGSGLGSSAASAAAAAVAVNALFGNALTKDELVAAGLRSEAAVSGFHADNVGPAILGGFVLIRSYAPLEILRLAYPEGRDLFFVVASPAFEAPTKDMRAALPTQVSMKAHVANSSQAAALVAAILTGDAQLLGSALASDQIVEPRRGQLIPGCAAVKVAASATGAYGCTISGAGPTSVAITDSREKGELIGRAMVAAFLEQGKLRATVSVQPLDRIGARVVEEE